MLYSNLQKSVFIIALLSMALACESKYAPSTAKDVLPFSTGDIEPKLGDGYDSLVQELRNTPSCVVGKTVTLSSGQSTIDLGQNVDADKVMKEFSGEVNGTPKLIFFNASAAAGFFRSLNANSSTVNIVYRVKIETGGEKLTDVVLDAEAKLLSPADFMRNCGDEYIMQVNRGGMLSITMNLDFSSEDNRKKWQALLKLSGSWADVAQDLGKKIENNTIDGSLTINVNQQGGIPSQALMAVRSCSLSSLEEFNVCKKMMDDIMIYASSAFPRQIESNPAILNYITAPVKFLGLTGLPLIEEKILDIRKELAGMTGTYSDLSEMLDKAKKVGLDFDKNISANITYNYELIKQVAKNCYSYDMGISSPDWSSCYNQFGSLTSRLKPVVAQNAEVKSLNIAAGNRIGNSIVNEYDKKITVVYTVSIDKSWGYDERSSVDYNGVPKTGGQAETNSDTINPNEKRGALLVRIDDNYRLVQLNGTLDIYPGEAVGFVMNEDQNKFVDNHGSQTVYYRCTNCQDSMKKVTTHRLTLNANQENGSSYRYHDSTMTSRYKITAYGLWRASSSWAWSNANGISKTCTRNCPLVDAQFQKLIAIQEGSGLVNAIGRSGSLAIRPNETVKFVMNDEAGGYRDNIGAIEIIMQCEICEISSHPVMITDDD